MLFIDPSDMPPEVQAYFEQQRMHSEAIRHDMQRFFDELSKDQLVTFRQLVNQALGGATKIYLAYLDGLAAGTLHNKFQVCGGCGKNHEEEAMAELAKPDEQVPTPTDFTALLEEYGVEHVKGGEKVRCKNCGFESRDLDDRMLRRPGAEGCEGCQHKAKFG